MNEQKNLKKITVPAKTNITVDIGNEKDHFLTGTLSSSKSKI